MLTADFAESVCRVTSGKFKSRLTVTDHVISSGHMYYSLHCSSCKYEEDTSQETVMVHTLCVHHNATQNALIA